MTEAIRILSPIHTRMKSIQAHSKFTIPTHTYPASSHPPSWPRDPVDPFSDLSSTPYYPSYPQDERNYIAPSRYTSNTLGWVHIFPEGMIHQSSTYHMRYFKWGVARLILEPDVCPDVVPMWIEGTDQIMHESREFPRFLPRCFKRVSVTFGTPVDTEARFGDLRRRWQEIKTAAYKKQGLIDSKTPQAEIDDLDVQLRGTLDAPVGRQAVHESMGVYQLWEETALRVREEVLKLRKERGWPDEDPKASAAATWAREGPKLKGRMEDGTWVGDT